MILFGIYVAIIALLIYVNGFFGFFSDDKISRKQFTFLFLIKAAAVPVFYFLFIKNSGVKLDAAKFYSDAMVMNNLAYTDFLEFIKMLFGLQDDTEGSYFHKTVTELTDNWDNGVKKDFFYNDNRIVIRLHAVLNFFTFGSYYVHALVACLFSYLGFFYLYRAFRTYFKGKEKFVFTILCLFPTLWLYTGAVLKEPWVVFFLGCLLFRLNRIMQKDLTLRSLVVLVVLVLVSLLLKPYILFSASCFFALFYFLQTGYKGKYKTLVFFGLLAGAGILINLLSVAVKNKSLLAVAVERQRDFADLAKGGIFLLDSVKFVRLDYNYDHVKKTADGKHFTIKRNIPYTYWEHSRQQDTLYCKNNADTVTQYSFVYDLPTAGSNIHFLEPSQNIAVTAVKSLYYTIAYPFFFNAHGKMQWLASLENLVLILALLLSLTGIIAGAKTNFVPIALLTFALGLFILVGITTPNSGAIIRYRSPAAVFILLSAVYSAGLIKNNLRRTKTLN